MEFAMTALIISVIFYGYTIYLKKRVKKVEIFDKHGKLTGQAHFIIQRGVKKDNTFL